MSKNENENNGTDKKLIECDLCDKVYSGNHARSILRRHLDRFHKIPLSNQPRKTRWDDDINRPKDDADKRQRVLECKRRYAKRKRQRNKSEKKDNDDNMSRSERANSVETMASTTTTNTTNTTTTTNTTATSNSQYHNESFNKLLASLNNNNDFNDNSLVENFINLPQFIHSRSPSPSTSNGILQYSQQPSIMDHFNSSPYVIQEQKDAALQLLSLGSPDTLHSYNHDINDNYNDNIQ